MEKKKSIFFFGKGECYLLIVHAFIPGKMFQKAVMGNAFFLLWALLKGESVFSSYVQIPESFIRIRQNDTEIILFYLTFYFYFY